MDCKTEELARLKAEAQRAYAAYRQATGETYGEINRCYTEAWQAYKEAADSRGEKASLREER